MKKIQLIQMEKISGGGFCDSFWGFLVAGFGGALIGGLFGGGGGAAAGWIGGVLVRGVACGNKGEPIVFM